MIKQKAEKTIKELLIQNEKSNEEIEYPKELKDIINGVRIILPQKEKQVWIIIETAIEKITMLKKEKFIIQTSKKIGRPKNARHKNKSGTNIHAKFFKSKK